MKNQRGFSFPEFLIAVVLVFALATIRYSQYATSGEGNITTSYKITAKGKKREILFSAFIIFVLSAGSLDCKDKFTV